MSELTKAGAARRAKSKIGIMAEGLSILSDFSGLFFFVHRMRGTVYRHAPAPSGNPTNSPINGQVIFE
jgi:hypothetical protein